MQQIYLASPYSDDSKPVRVARAHAASAFVSWMLAKESHNLFIYSPIVHFSQTAENYNLRKDFNFWAELDFFQISRSGKLWILPLAGWEDSKGIKEEIAFAQDKNIPIEIIQSPKEPAPNSDPFYITSYHSDRVYSTFLLSVLFSKVSVFHKNVSNAPEY